LLFTCVVSSFFLGAWCGRSRLADHKENSLGYDRRILDGPYPFSTGLTINLAEFSTALLC
jgi:hypothetical protein